MENDNLNVTSERLSDGSINYIINRNLKSENDIFWYDRNKDSVILKETDGKKYFLHIGLFFIKVPYEFIVTKEEKSGDKVWYRIEEAIIKYMLNDYYEKDDSFKQYIIQKEYDINEIKNKLYGTKDISGNVSEVFCHYYYDLTEYFDTWAVIKTDDNFTNISRIILKPKGDEHIETINWE